MRVNETERPTLAESTIAVRGTTHHAFGQEVTPPIHLSSTFVHPSVPAPGEYSYGRGGNPANEQLEPVLAAIEGGDDCVIFNAGIAAANAVLAEAAPGTALVMPWDAYYGIRVRAAKELPKLGVEVRLVDQTDLGAVERALDGASLLWAETPTNPLLAVANLEEIGRLAARAGVPWYVDNTFATPILQHPIAFGATGSMHSLTKYVGGHSDLLLGAVITADPEAAARLRARRNESGTQGDGFSIWLARRGLQTLPLRVRHQAAAALELAERLSGHPSVAQVFYPGLPGHPGHEVAKTQMRGGFGGMLSILVAGGAERAQAVVERCELWVPATSLGGVESLLERRARWAGETAPGELLRLSVGLEDIEDLWRDLDQALSAV
jgi:cystathionine gamma-synthase